MVTLSQVNVVATAERSDATEGTGSYAAKAISLGKGGVRSLREVPQTVSVVTRQQIEDQNLRTVADALDHVTGVYSANTFSNNTESTVYKSRGFDVVYSYDGLPSMASAAFQTSGIDDTATLDRVEVLRGPAALLRDSSGGASFGGVINAVRKKPQSEYSVSGQVSAGSWNNYRGWIDVGGPLNESGSVRARGVLSAGDRDYWYGTTAHKKDWTAYAVMEADLTPNTQWSGSITHTEAKATQPLTRNVLRNLDGTLLSRDRTATGNDPRSFLNTENTVLSTQLSHSFDSGWKAQGSLVYQEWKESADLMQWGTEVVPATQTTYYERTKYDPYGARNWAYDLNVSGPLSFLGADHKLTLGMDNNRIRYKYKDYAYEIYAEKSITNPAIDFLSPITTEDLTDILYFTRGYYAVGQFKIAPSLNLVLGARATSYKYGEELDDGSFNLYSKVSNKITSHAGLIWDLNKQTTLYASYADLFVPQTNKDINGNFLDPRTGEQFEIGLKRELWDGRLNASMALYRIRDKNRPIIDEDHSGCVNFGFSGSCYKAAGLVQSQGLDAEISGSPTPGLQIIAGYTYNQNKYLADSRESNIGKQISGTTPRHLVKLFATYKFGTHDFDGALIGWRIGGGVTAQSKTYASDTVRQGGYAVVNAQVGYYFNAKTSATFSINNLFDRYYTTSGLYIWGKPRSFNLALRHQF